MIPIVKILERDDKQNTINQSTNDTLIYNVLVFHFGTFSVHTFQHMTQILIVLYPLKSVQKWTIEFKLCFDHRLPLHSMSRFALNFPTTHPLFAKLLVRWPSLLLRCPHTSNFFLYRCDSPRQLISRFRTPTSAYTILALVSSVPEVSRTIKTFKSRDCIVQFQNKKVLRQ